MNSYRQVFQTYFYRPRFWVLGLLYLWIVLYGLWIIVSQDRHDRDVTLIGAIASAGFTALVACFLGLHLRRQFCHAGAQLVPGYAVPHLVVAASVVGVLWLVVPGVFALAGYWPKCSVAMHVGTPILMALVACWPRTILLLPATPVLLGWSISPHGPLYGSDWLERLAVGRLPWLAAGLIAVAVVMQVVAAWVLLRMPRLGIVTNDEFTVEAPVPRHESNSLSQWLLKTRDAAAERLLDASWNRSIQRWRVPMAISPAQLMIPVCIVLAAAGFGWLFSDSLGSGGWSALALIITSVILLLVPLASWQSRLRAMSQEVLRPVTREQYFREMIVAHARDMATWTSVSSLLILCWFFVRIYSASRPDLPSNYLPAISYYLLQLWGVALFVFGVGLATLRLPMWLPIVAGITMGWLGAVWSFLLFVVEGIPPSNRDPMTALLWFLLITASMGIVLVAWTYLRWVRNDVT